MVLANQTARQRVEASDLAKSKLEYFRSTGVCDTADSGTYTPVQGNTQYNITVTCPTNKTPKVVVTWFDSRGGQDKTTSGVTSKVANNLEFNTTLD